MKTVTFVAGLAAGYVLGTRAGREKYQQIVAGARSFAEQPTVVQAQAKLKDLAVVGKDKVAAKLPATLTSPPSSSSTSSVSGSTVSDPTTL